MRRILTIVCVGSAWIVTVSLAQAAATRTVQIGVIGRLPIVSLKRFDRSIRHAQTGERAQ
jgi:hypothetical protein